MTELVFLEPNKIDAVPFTTSKVIAEFAGVQHHTVTRLIQQYENDLKEFGSLRFEIEVRKREVGATTAKTYHLTEEQATLLMTYLKNTEKVRAFKKELVRQFYAMRQELTRRAVERAKLTPVRREMTDIIRDCVPDSPHKAMMYKHYTDLAYRAALGKTAAQLRKERGAGKKANATEYLTAAELAAVEVMTQKIGVLIEIRPDDYGFIKSLVLQPASVLGTGQDSAYKSRPKGQRERR